MVNDMEYKEFLKQKIEIAPKTGLEITAEDANPALLPHQRDAVICLNSVIS